MIPLVDKPGIQYVVEEAVAAGITDVLMRFPADEIGKYGVVATDGSIGADDVVRITTTVEKPARGTEPSDLAIIGRYVLTPDVFDRIAQLRPGAIGEIQLTDALCQM